MQPEISCDLSPAERRRQRVRDAIIAAAERVFAREGEEGLSIRRLADEIDYSPSAIYKYFGSKEELVEELKDAFFERLLAHVDDTSSGCMTFAERARACVETYVRTAVERPYHYAAAFSSIQVPDSCQSRPLPDWPTFSKTPKGRAFQVLIDMVTEGQALDVFDATHNPFLAAKSVWASSHGLASLMIHVPQFWAVVPEGEPPSRDEFIAFHADLIFRSLKKLPAQAVHPAQDNGAES